jgi:hypothetical protein
VGQAKRDPIFFFRWISQTFNPSVGLLKGNWPPRDVADVQDIDHILAHPVKIRNG